MTFNLKKTFPNENKTMLMQFAFDENKSVMRAEYVF